MIVIADTTPLNYLIRLGLADLLHEIYGQVLVPHAVLAEMRHARTPAAVRAFALNPPIWVQPVEALDLDGSLPQELGAGEREAISLALQLKADVLLMDEFVGRMEAEARHLHVAGTLAVLLQGALIGRLKLVESIAQLRSYGFRVSVAVEKKTLLLYERALKEAGK